MRTSTLQLGALIGGLVLVPLADAQGLSMVERFGPDGLPFTWDDPLTVGASASEYRFGAMAADTCSEEEGISPGNSAHGFPSAGGHPSINETNLDTSDQWAVKLHKHEPLPTPEEIAANLTNYQEAPFDTTQWLVALDLDDLTTTRFRMFPEDIRWTAPEEESAFDTLSRGWPASGGWQGSEPTPNSDGISMNTVWQDGSPAKNLHIEAAGLGYRDLKPTGGFTIAIKNETLQIFPQFPSTLADAKVNLYTEQNYLEGWVLELTNLDNQATGVSGNFVADLAGLRITVELDDVTIPADPCDVDIDDVTLELGGPVRINLPGGADPLTENAKPPSQYVKDNLMDAIVDEVFENMTLSGSGFLSGLACALGDAMKDFLRPIIEDKMEEKMLDKLQAMDFIWGFVGDDSFEVIGKYSGLAGRKGKNPFDKVALGTLEQMGQFKPQTWLPWKVVGDIPTAFDFEIDSFTTVDIKTSSGVLRDQISSGSHWRYNNGSSYLMKSSMLFGNSAGEDDDPTPATALSPAAQEKVPDILRSFAERWVHLRMDILDPYKRAESEGLAIWQSEDVLFQHGEAANEEFTVDWPPPNWHSGRGQLAGFRSGSGGEIQLGEPVDVRVESTLQANWMVCVDPVGRTFSVAGLWFRPGETATYTTRGLSRKGADFGWTSPRPLPDDLDSKLDNRSGLRWLAAGAGHHFDAEAELQWMWDFEADGTLDSDHGRHMSDLGASPNFPGGYVTAVFAFEPRAGGGGELGRTGFSLVPADRASRQAYGAVP